MATSFPSAPNDGLRSRWGHDQSWSCLKHFEPIKFYCSSHKITLCPSCALKEHQKPCCLRDIEDKIKELTKELRERNVNIEQAKAKLRDFDAKLKECTTKSEDHISAVKASYSLHTSFHDEMKAIDEKQRMKESAINEKADDDIRIINERREEQIKQSAEEAEQQRASIRDLRGELLREVDRIAAKAGHYIDQLKEKSTATSHDIKDSEEKIRRLHKSDSDLVNFAAPVFEALDETLQGIDIEEDVACAERAVRAVRKVTCSVSNVNGTLRGRIDTGEWKRVHTISPDLGGWVVGSVSDDEIGVNRSVDGKCVFSIVDVNTHQETARIIAEEGSSITSCAAVSSELIVCGKERWDCEGDHLTGLVSLYDRRGQLVRDITIPRHTTGNYTCVYVDVDGDGKVVAAELNQPHIYVLNPSDGAIVRYVTLPVWRKVWGCEISSLRDSSGDVVVCTWDGVYSIVSRSGAVKTTICNDAWEFARCSVDMVTGALYFLCSDDTPGVHRVDRCTSEGVIAERGVVEYPGKGIAWCGVAITPTGKLVVNDSEDRIFIYKQSFNLTQP